MKRHPCLAILSLCAALSPALVQAQSPTTTRSPTQVTPLPTSPPAPRPAPPRQLSNPVQSPAPSGPIPTQLGQRQAAPVFEAKQPTQSSNSPAPALNDPVRQIGATPARVYDRNGVPVTGMEQAGPNRVRDSRTGRYYDTAPAGDGQRIVP